MHQLNVVMLTDEVKVETREVGLVKPVFTVEHEPATRKRNNEVVGRSVALEQLEQNDVV